MIYTLEGGGRISNGSRGRTLKPHEAVLYAPEIYQDYRTDAGVQFWRLIWAHFLPPAHWSEWLRWPEWLDGIRILSVHEPEEQRHIVDRFRTAHRLRVGGRPDALALGVNALEEVLIRCASQIRHPEETDDRIKETLGYIGEHLDADLSIASLSRRSGLSPAHFARLFRRDVGTSPQTFIEARRMTRARELLHFTQLSIKEIAYRLGFGTPFYFSLRFKKETGQSPSDFRHMQVQRHRTYAPQDTP